MTTFFSLFDLSLFAGGFAVAWIFKDKVLAFVAKVKAKF